MHVIRVLSAAVALAALLHPPARAVVPQPDTMRGIASPAATLSSAGEGRRVYLKLNCYGCHGMHGYGTMGPNIAGEGDVTEWIYAGGVQGMPSFRALMTSTDILNMNAYLKSIGTPVEPTFTHWWEAVPSQ